MKDIKTLQEAIQYFSDEQTCIEALTAMRWPDGKPVCPACEGTQHYYLKTQRRWKCKECRRQFSVKLNSIFEDSPIGLDKWMVAIWMIANCKNGVSSYEIHRAIGVTQKSAWFMLHRIRLAMQDKNETKLGGKGKGYLEADETFVGGNLKNMHKDRKIRYIKRGGAHGKTIVMGILDRKAGKVRAEVIPNTTRESLQSTLLKHVEPWSTVCTDDYTGYTSLKWFNHEVINKMVEGYIKGKVHTQGIENFWSLLKRGLHGTYVAVEPYHMFRYLDEQMFRYNNRKDGKEKVSDGERFKRLLSQVSKKRLTFAELTSRSAEIPVN